MSRDSQPFIELRKLYKSFDSKAVLQGIDLAVFPGETLVIMGASGSGKSVLLRHINALLRPDSGEVYVDGERLNDLDEDQLVPVRKKVAMVFQLGALFDSLTVHGNVSYSLREHTRMTEEQIDRRVEELLGLVEMSHTESLYPAQLSGGMKKRVALARAIALQPKGVLFDEPTAALDPLVARKINLLIRNLQKRLGLTSVVVTHDLQCAFMVGDRFALLDGGKIRFQGDLQAVRQSRDELLREFLESAGQLGAESARL